VDDFSVTSHVTHDPEVFGVDDFGGVTMTTGQANTTTTTTFETNLTVGEITGGISPEPDYSNHGNDNSSDDNSSSDPDGGAGGGWT
jgi:hypothetical protein